MKEQEQDAKKEIHWKYIRIHCKSRIGEVKEELSEEFFGSRLLEVIGFNSVIGGITSVALLCVTTQISRCDMYYGPCGSITIHPIVISHPLYRNLRKL